jgi:ATP-dependent DNA helicase RecG
MKEEGLDFILQEGEGYKIEFKETASGIDKDIVAFSNAEGGRIFIGISDDKKIIGINLTNRLKSEIQNIARNCDPPANITFDKVRDTMIINVKEGEDKPYKCGHGFYLRVGPNSQKLTRDEILNFAIGEGKIKFDEQLNPKFDFKKDFDKTKLKKFLLRAGIKSGLSAEDVLVNLGIAQRQKGGICLTNAGILFFAKEPQRFFRDSYVTCARFKGKDRVDVIDRKDIAGDLAAIVDECENFVKRNTRLAYSIEGFRRKEIPEYPMEAIREGILNAVMHRDYFFRGSNVFIYIYSDRIEMTNPGGLPKGLKKEDFGRKSVRRNPLIADLFHRIGYVEKMGTGIRRMNELMRKHGLKIPRCKSNAFFDIIFYGPGEKMLGEEIDLSKHDLNERQRKAVEFLKKNGRIALKDFKAIQPNLTEKTIYRDLKDLQDKGIVKAIGKKKGRYYVLA